MRWLGTIWLRMRSLFRRREAESELDDGLRFHLERTIEQNLSRGMTREEARREALVEIGGVEQVKEECREARGWHFLADTWRDVCYGARMLRKSPGFVIAAVLTLALGIGLNSTIFSLLNGLFLREPPVRDPQDVIVVTPANPSFGSLRISPTPTEFAAWREGADALDEIAAAERGSRVLTGAGEPTRIAVELVTPNYFRAVGVSPFLGRGFDPAADASRQDREVVISYRLWRQILGAKRRIVGKTILLSNRTYTVIGVMPVDIRYAVGPCDAWIPANFAALSMSPQERNQRGLEVIGRLKAGVPIERAQAEFAARERSLARTFPTERGLTTRVERLREYRTNWKQRVFAPILGTLTAIVLLVACMNLAGMFLARCKARRGEFAIRAALGASRRRTVRQLMVEALLLGLLGGCAAFLGSVWGAAVLRAGFGANPAVAWQLAGIRVDRTVLLFTVCVSVLAVLLFGLAPAIYTSRTDLNSMLKESGYAKSIGTRRHWMPNSFIVVQVALAVFLTVAAGTMAGKLFQQLMGPRGFEPRGVLTAEVPLSGEHYARAGEQTTFFSEAIRRIQSLPRLRSAALVQELPVARKQVIPFEVEGHPPFTPAALSRTAFYSISPHYFRVMHIPLLRGRSFMLSDHHGTPAVAIISAVFAERYFQHTDPVGKHLRLYYSGAEGTPETVEIVGVVGNIATNPLRQHKLQIYVPFLQEPRASMTLVLRARGDPADLASAVRQSVWAIDSNQPVGNIQTLREVIAQRFGGEAFLGELLTGMVLLALTLAALGIYAVVANTVVERTHEIGLRVALGAGKSQIFRMVVAKGVLLTGIGLALGLLVVASIPRYLVHIFSFHATLFFMTAPLVILTTALLACYVPARRAMRVDPNVALRHESGAGMTGGQRRCRGNCNWPES